MDLDLVAVILTTGTVASGLLAFVAGIFQRRARARAVAALEEARAEETEDYARVVLNRLPAAEWADVYSVWEGTEPKPETSNPVRDLEGRLKAIEERLPHASTVDKIASINDAVLATKIEVLERDVSRLEGQMLSRWDVAMVMFAVIGALGAIVGLIAGAIKLF